MAEKRKCLCCGKEYEYCNKCGKSSTPWKFNYDTEACKELFNVVSGYNMGIIKEDGIKKILDQYSITDFSEYRDSIKDLLQKLFNKKVGDPIPATEEVLFETIQQEEVKVEDNSVEAEQENQINEAPRNRRRNRFFE